jgi:predicted transcriptional regulator
MGKMEGRDGRRPGTFWIDNELVTVYAKDIGVHAFAVYMVLVQHSRDNECFPSTSTIAEELSISRPTVSKAIRTLEDAGLIHIEERKLPVRGQTSHYYMILQVPKTAVKEIYSGSQTAVKEIDRPRKGDLQRSSLTAVKEIDSINNTDLNNTNLTSGGVAPPSTDAAAAADQSLIDDLMEAGLDRSQAITAAQTRSYTADQRKYLKLWHEQCNAQKPGAVLWKYLKRGDLPPDLIPRPARPQSGGGVRTGPAMSIAPDYDIHEARRRSAEYDRLHPIDLPEGA